MEPTLVVSALAASVASGLFLAAGMNLRRSTGDADARRAVELFGVWWVGLAVYAVAGACQDMVAAFGATPLVLFVTLRYMQIAAVCIGLWGLMYYVGYVLTGERRLMVPLALFYGGYYAVLLFLVTLGLPADVEAGAWSTDLVYESPLLGALALALLLVIPPLAAALQYLFLSFHAQGRGQRLRIVLIVASTFAWSAGSLAREVEWTALVPAVLGVLSAACVSWAYRPPGWLRDRMETAPAG